MSVKRVLLLSGVPGSGKSYWAKNKFMPYIPNTAYISRDEVRFSMLTDSDEYFAKEDAVFAEFITRINTAIANEKIHNIIVDATHLNWASRNKTLRNLHLKDCQVVAVVFNTPLEMCLNRNEKREGRAKVPRGVIRRMFYQRTNPDTDPFEWDDIIEPNKEREPE